MLFQAPLPALVVECRLPADEDERVFRLIDRGGKSEPRWVLVLRARPLGERAIELPLAGARVTQTTGRVTASSRSANGGIAVEIDARAGGSTVDVFVNYELEVNVWRDLSPDVERMNTAGLRRDATCEVLPVLPGAAQLP